MKAENRFDGSILESLSRDALRQVRISRGERYNLVFKEITN